ncbi:MAG: RHS repeat-associated core domain-containing protein [Pyrinomonadaceae bacterium]
MARIESFIGSAKQWTQKFRYDSVGRLKEAEEFRGDIGALSFEQIFEFDNFGNLYRKSASNPGSGEDPIAFEPIENTDIDKSTNRFSSASGVAYDNAGRVVSDDKFRDADFLYDANGRMVRTARSGVPDAETVYDGFGNRVLTKVQGVWELALYDAFGRLSVEYGGAAQIDEGGVRYVHQDHQGSVRTVTNAAGFVAARRDYQPFGEAIQAGIGLRTGAQGYEGGVGARQGYGFTEKDDGSGLVHAWFRKLENAAGRWTGPDPYVASLDQVLPQSLNRYAYVFGEPTNYVDPSGLIAAANCAFRTYVITSCVEGVGCTIDSIEVRYVCTHNVSTDSGRRGPAELPIVGGGRPGRDSKSSTDSDCMTILMAINYISSEIINRFNRYYTFRDGDPGHARQIEERQRQLGKEVAKYKQNCKDGKRPEIEKAHELMKRKVPDYGGNHNFALDGSDIAQGAAVTGGVILTVVVIKKLVGGGLIFTPAAPVGAVLILTP